MNNASICYQRQPLYTTRNRLLSHAHKGPRRQLAATHRHANELIASLQSPPRFPLSDLCESGCVYIVRAGWASPTGESECKHTHRGASLAIIRVDPQTVQLSRSRSKSRSLPNRKERLQSDQPSALKGLQRIKEDTSTLITDEVIAS
ncbi:hypothetical protein RRG08_027050 [Elysia crispata]|uniref:Uncharacterized protein n=1 Tax=Elysia crispata TaxID=231223 RepID=A0AAE0ZHU1_9GAST|nr:hypothetical protein RRG08_027050 [Elysia crispata]